MCPESPYVRCALQKQREHVIRCEIVLAIYLVLQNNKEKLCQLFYIFFYNEYRYEIDKYVGLTRTRSICRINSSLASLFVIIICLCCRLRDCRPVKIITKLALLIVVAILCPFVIQLSRKSVVQAPGS